MKMKRIISAVLVFAFLLPCMLASAKTGEEHEADLEKAINDNDDAFFSVYDKLIVDLYLNKQLNVCKVTLDISTLTGGTHTTYKSEIGGNTTEASTRDVFDFASGIQKSVLSAAADMLAAVEDEDEEE